MVHIIARVQSMALRTPSKLMLPRILYWGCCDYALLNSWQIASCLLLGWGDAGMKCSRAVTSMELHLMPHCASCDGGPFKFNHKLSWYSPVLETPIFRIRNVWLVTVDWNEPNDPASRREIGVGFPYACCSHTQVWRDMSDMSASVCVSVSCGQRIYVKHSILVPTSEKENRFLLGQVSSGTSFIYAHKLLAKVTC